MFLNELIDVKLRADMLGCYTSEQVAVRYLAHEHCSTARGGELAPLQLPVHTPQCGLCWT